MISQLESQQQSFAEGDHRTAAEITRASGETFAGAVEGLLPTDSRTIPKLDWELAPVNFLSSTIEEIGPRVLDPPTFAPVSYASDYMVRKGAETPNLPWYGYQAPDGKYGVWAKSPSRLTSHAGYILSFHEGQTAVSDYSSCPLQFTYLRPGASLWRTAPPPYADCCRGRNLNTSCLPGWLQTALGNSTVLRSPGILHDPNGALPDASGNRTMHFAVYYSTQLSTKSSDGLACIGRVSGRWLGHDPTCTPRIYWEDDGKPILCSNVAANVETDSEVIPDVSSGSKYDSEERWLANSDGEALAYGANPYYGFDGSVYLAYGAREPGNVKIVQLNESSGRLPKVAQPGSVSFTSDVYHTAATGPDFELGADTRAPPTGRPAYLTGKIKPLNSSISLVQNAFIWPRRYNGTSEYYLFVDWFGHEEKDVNSSLSRIYVGRSVDSPTGPFLDRLGNDMSTRSHIVPGDTRTISIVSALWGANCDRVGYDVKAVAKLKCEGETTCNWQLNYEELDPIDPKSYSYFAFPPESQTVATQFGPEPNNYADSPGCLRAMNITYRCDKKAVVLYEGENLGEEYSISIDPEAANGTIVRLRCETPPPVQVPGGSLFADPQKLGGNLHFTSIGHSGVFSYHRRGKTINVFTFQYRTNRSTVPELGARRIRFAGDGWPVLEEDYTSEWATCGVPEAAYDRKAPDSYWETEAHYDPEHSREAHYTASSSSLTHCTHHSRRGTHCVGNSLRATHPQINVAGPEGSQLHGTIDEVGTVSYWRDQEEHCNPVVETQLGRKINCQRFEGRGDLNPANHTSTMERIRGCPQLECARRFACRPDPRTRAAAGTLDSCTEGLSCKKLPQLRVAAWDSADFFDGGQPIMVTRDGLVRSNLAPLQQCHATPVISNINPALGDVAGGTLVTVHGTGFGSPARCRFGLLETMAENVTSHLMLCRVPELPQDRFPGLDPREPSVINPRWMFPVMLEVSMMWKEILELTPLTDAVREVRGENFTANRFIFEYMNSSRFSISFLRPSGGPTAGATHIDVHGSGFLANDRNNNVKCRFTVGGHRTIVQATFHNSERISCFSPAQHANAPADVDLTFNEQRFVGENKAFQYYTLQNKSDEVARLPYSVAISRIHPIGGPSRGGTAITLFGTGFAPLDDPSRSAESVQNRELYRLNDPYHDLHRSTISRLGLFCLFKGVDVVILGAAIPHGEEVRRDVIVATATSSDRMVCTTPPYNGFDGSFEHVTSDIPVDITVNGNPAERTNSGVKFRYYREDRHVLPKLHGVQPFGGPAAGGTVVTIHGSLLLTLVEIGGPVCRFDSGVDNTTTVPATIRGTNDNTQIVLCVSPMLRTELKRRDVPLNVAQNGQDYVRRPLRFQYYAIDKLVLEQIHPSGGPTAGGTLVHINGKHIGVSRGGIECQFGPIWVGATSIDEHSLRCVSPALERDANSTFATLAVRLTVNGEYDARTPSSLGFTYFEPTPALTVSSIYPESGYFAGGTWVTVTGRGFRDLGGVYCRFGASAPVRAIAPPLPPSPAPAPGRDGDLRLRNGGVNWQREGRVEVFYNGTWGTVCDDFWDIEDARTVCRQLGFNDALGIGFFGPGAGQIWLDNVNCGALKPDRLDQCGHHGWGVHDCDHHEDAGVRCMPLPTNTTPLPPPVSPPPPLEPWSRLDDYQVTRGRDGAYLGREEPVRIDDLYSMNASEFDQFICLSPPLHEALGKHDHRAVVKSVEVQISLNNDTFGEGTGRNFTYYRE